MAFCHYIDPLQHTKHKMKVVEVDKALSIFFLFDEMGSVKRFALLRDVKTTLVHIF